MRHYCESVLVPELQAIFNMDVSSKDAPRTAWSLGGPTAGDDARPPSDGHQTDGNAWTSSERL